jgi:hypothetical protein
LTSGIGDSVDSVKAPILGGLAGVDPPEIKQKPLPTSRPGGGERLTDSSLRWYGVNREGQAGTMLVIWTDV